MNAREAAVDTLTAVDREGAYSNLEIRRALSRKFFVDEDKRLYVNLVYGTLQNRLYLDWILEKFVDSGKKIQPVVREILRMSIYQLVFLDRIPAYAVINEAVEITGRRQRRARGFVNGVLRNFARHPEAAEISGDYFDNEKDYLSVRYSIPVGIVHQYFRAYGADKAVKIISRLNEAPPLFLRVNTLKTNREKLIDELKSQGIEAVPGKMSDAAVKISDYSAGESVENLVSFRKGWITVQDEGAMKIVECLDPKPGDSVLDMCAAPGGKTTHMAELMKNTGSITARDVYDSRIALIEETADRMGISIITAEKADGQILKDEDIGRFDKILLDAPCSGTGIIRRKPEIRYAGTKKARREIRAVQRKFLANALEMLKSGGELVYSTCTVDPAENQELIDAVCAGRDDLTVGRGNYTDPLEDGCDSFFYCKIKKH